MVNVVAGRFWMPCMRQAVGGELYSMLLIDGVGGEAAVMHFILHYSHLPFMFKKIYSFLLHMIIGVNKCIFIKKNDGFN